jgi:hypothetical protein
MGTTLAGLMADYIIICRGMFDKPEVFIAGTDMIKSSIHKGIKNEKISYWLQPKNYEEFKDNWILIGQLMRLLETIQVMNKITTGTPPVAVFRRCMNLPHQSI